MSTIKDVAQAAGVSIATVSSVVNGTRRVSGDLTQRVLEAMEALDYRPNSLARSLRMGQTKTLGLVTPDNANPFFAEISRAIEEIGFQNGYSVILCNSDGDAKRQRKYIRVLMDKQVDGVLFISAGESVDDVRYLTDRGVKVVIVDREAPNIPADVVLVDNEQAGYRATRYLIDLKHRRIACIAGPRGLGVNREEGYYRALGEAGIALDPDYVILGDYHMDKGEQAASKLLSLATRPTAIFACNDLMAIGAMYRLTGAGLRIPEDVSIVGFDDIALVKAFRPALTTVAHPKAEMARIATEMLIGRIHGDASAEEWQRVVLPAELVIRDSCAPCRDAGQEL